MSYQKCPICNGAGRHSGYQQLTTDASTFCKTCNGHGIIHEVTGLPPTYRLANAHQDKIDELKKAEIIGPTSGRLGEYK